MTKYTPCPYCKGSGQLENMTVRYDNLKNPISYVCELCLRSEKKPFICDCEKFTEKKMMDIINDIPIMCDHDGINSDSRCKKCNKPDEFEERILREFEEKFAEKETSFKKKVKKVQKTFAKMLHDKLI